MEQMPGMLLSALSVKVNLTPEHCFMLEAPLRTTLLFTELDLSCPLKIGQVSWPEPPSLSTMISSIFHAASGTHEERSLSAM